MKTEGEKQEMPNFFKQENKGIEYNLGEPLTFFTNLKEKNCFFLADDMFTTENLEVVILTAKSVPALKLSNKHLKEADYVQIFFVWNNTVCDLLLKGRSMASYKAYLQMVSMTKIGDDKREVDKEGKRIGEDKRHNCYFSLCTTKMAIKQQVSPTGIYYSVTFQIGEIFNPEAPQQKFIDVYNFAGDGEIIPKLTNNFLVARYKEYYEKEKGGLQNMPENSKLLLKA